MPKPNRGYKKNEPFRDASLFIIACEGEKREKEYFESLVDGSKSIRVKMLAPVDEDKGKSAPKWVLNRAVTYEEEYGLVGQGTDSGDHLYLVLDVDRWGFEDLKKIYEHCNDKQYWEIIISNPCFETWLFLHKKEFESGEQGACKELKTKLDDLTPSGYEVYDYLQTIDEAIDRAKKIDKTPEYFFPEVMTTKVYKLVEEILSRKSRN